MAYNRRMPRRPTPVPRALTCLMFAGASVACLMFAGASVACSTPSSVVRMAHPEEFPRPPMALATSGQVPEDCELVGDEALDLYEPVATYARAHLVRAIERFTGYTSERIDIHRATSARQLPPLPEGFSTLIVVVPRTRRGQLVIGQFEVYKANITWGATIEYCLRVITENGQRTIVLERRNAIIGSRDANELDGSDELDGTDMAERYPTWVGLTPR
jgi:hypothetical protein